jgi:hypothetical protein
MLTDNQIHGIIILLLLVIIYLLYQREKFTTECKNRDCYQCTGSKEVYRNQYCLDNTAQHICPDGYKLDDNTKRCYKDITNENKVYQFEAPAKKVCGENEIQVGDVCVTEATHFFDPNNN